MDESRLFQQILIRAHRRRVTWRLLEHAAIGLLVGCGIASIILAIAWWREVEPTGPVVAILFVASITGSVASRWRSPSLIDTARLIETQLRSPELLSSAMLASNLADRSFVDALRALADARVAGVSPSSLVLRRLGSRAWSGVGLATAGVIVVAFMISAPVSENRATANSADAADAWLADRADPESATLSKQFTPHDPTPQREPVSSSSMTAENASSPPARPGTAAPLVPGESNASINSRGPGSANSEPTASNVPNASPRLSPGSNDGSLAAAGAGVAAVSGASGDRATGIVNPAVTGAAMVPWKSESWPRDRDAALETVRNGAIPDSYRLLVQDYFQRP